jgi:hypothetical protein
MVCSGAFRGIKIPINTRKEGSMTQDMSAENPTFEGLAPPARVFTLTLVEVTSVLVITFRKRPAMSAKSIAELRAFYRKVLTHNLLLGWWGFPFGLIWTPWALVTNRRALLKLRHLMASGAVAAGWFPDPTGRHQTRYWDGQRWTDQVSDPRVGSDPPAASTHPTRTA